MNKKVPRRGNRQICKQKILRKTDILAQILFAWFSWDSIEHGNIPMGEHGQKASFREEEWQYQH